MNFFFILAMIATIFTGIGFAICLIEMVWPSERKFTGEHWEVDERPTWNETVILGMLFIMFSFFATIFYVQ